MSTHPRRSRPSAGAGVKATYAYVAVVYLAAATLIFFGWRMAGPPQDLFALVVLWLMGVISWAAREREVGTRIQISFLSIVMLSSAVIVGPVGAALVGAGSTVLREPRSPPIVRLFNTAMHTCMGAIGGITYLLAGGAPDVRTVTDPMGIIAQVGLPMMVADVAQCVANAVLLSGVMRVSQGIPFQAQVWSLLTTTGPAYVGYGIIGFLFVILWIPAGVGWFSAVLILAPLLAARWAFVQYGEEQRAHERTLNALVSAVEAKDPQSKGHSTRVAQLCTWIAEAMSLGRAEVQDVRTAGMLHDLGKLAVPSRLLRARHELTDDEVVLLADHPLVGVDMLAGITFLAGSLEGVAHHHERFDGLGYPDGLTGTQIPLVARIVSVADAWDALTTTRVYRPALQSKAALGELHARSGAQFDPRVVAALERALSRHGWTPTTRDGSFFPSPEAPVDHDDPVASDRIANSPGLRAAVRERAATTRHTQRKARAVGEQRAPR
jgi:HD domain